MDLQALHDWLGDELRECNRRYLAGLLELERRTLEGRQPSAEDRRLILDAMDSATNTLALGEPEREEILIARRILLACESIRIHALLNDQRDFCTAFQPAGDDHAQCVSMPPAAG